MNYQALGEHTAFKTQAKNAAFNRVSHVNNLMFSLRKVRDDSPDAIDVDSLRAQISEIEKADIDMRDALARTNRAGDECGQRELTVADLLRS